MADTQVTLLRRHVGETRELPSGALVKVLRMEREDDHLCAVVVYAPAGRGAKSFLLRADWFLQNAITVKVK
jgi:hypothetical protein